MISARPAAAMIFIALINASAAQTIADVEGMSVREYAEQGIFMRAQIMEPVAKKAGVRYLDLNACLKASADHPTLRRESIRTAVSACIEWAKENGRKPD